jgi:uncharacterized protein YbcI
MDTNTTTLDCNNDNCDDRHTGTTGEQIAQLVCAFQHKSTGHMPKAVSVILGEDTLVVVLHGGLTPAERALAKSAAGAAQVQDFHRQLFAASSESLRGEIKRITGRQVREGAAEIEPTTGSIVHAFTSGTMVQVFLLTPSTLPKLEAAAV